jgi:hypothetical protein
MRLLAACFFLLGSCTVGRCADEDRDTIVVEWNKAVLNAVRHSTLGPPVVARALAIVHTCIYDAWAAYDSRAVGTKFQDGLRRPEQERTPQNKKIAISYAAYRAAIDLFPSDKATVFDPFMTQHLNYDPNNQSTDTKTPVGVGNAACAAVLESRHRDGSNQLGDMDTRGVPYSDYTGYSPANPAAKVPINPATVKNPLRFQPVYYPGEFTRLVFSDSFLGAHWFRVTPFAGPYTNELSQVASKFPPAQLGSKAFEIQAMELVDVSASLTDEQKMISEYWTDGPNSEFPPGHWCLFAQFVSERDHHTLDDDAKLYFALTNAVFDAGIAAWTAKRTFDSVRPVTAIPFLLRGKAIESWGGPGKGTITIDATEWIPYQPSDFPSPPFPEYPSGHSAFSAAAARILEIWTGSERFGESITLAPGTSKIEPGLTPRSKVILRWPTFASAADQAGFSRRYGGLHFKTGDLAGRALGRLVAEKVWQRVSGYFGECQ